MTQQTQHKQQKSTPLLLLCIFLLFYAGLIFRAGINTLYFTQDASEDYAQIIAVIQDLQPDPSVRPGETPFLIPVFTFEYKGETMTLAAPNLHFSPAQKKLSFKQGEEYPLWLHKIQGKLLLPPTASQKQIGRSQMVISAVCILLALVAWVLRNKLAIRAARKQTEKLL